MWVLFHAALRHHVIVNSSKTVMSVPSDSKHLVLKAHGLNKYFRYSLHHHSKYIFNCFHWRIEHDLLMLIKQGLKQVLQRRSKNWIYIYSHLMCTCVASSGSSLRKRLTCVSFLCERSLIKLHCWFWYLNFSCFCPLDYNAWLSYEWNWIMYNATTNSDILT